MQGPSPDEVALVEAGRRLGFEFLGRTRTDVSFSVFGRRMDYKVLNLLDFTSDRARCAFYYHAFSL